MFLKTCFDTEAVFVLNECPTDDLLLVHGVTCVIDPSIVLSAATAPKFSKSEVKNTFWPQLSNGLETQPSNRTGSVFTQHESALPSNAV